MGRSDFSIVNNHFGDSRLFLDLCPHKATQTYIVGRADQQLTGVAIRWYAYKTKLLHSFDASYQFVAIPQFHFQSITPICNPTHHFEETHGREGWERWREGGKAVKMEEAGNFQLVIQKWNVCGCLVNGSVVTLQDKHGDCDKQHTNSP